jgi:diguanylate cyclase (GGDEF)-like protein
MASIPQRRRVIENTRDIDDRGRMARRVQRWQWKLDRLLRRYVGRDALTGIGTAAQGMRGLACDVQRDEAAVIFCDMDNMLAFNYANGHGCGDQLLRLVAATLMAGFVATQPYGRGVYRIGGDEFLIRLPGRDLTSAQTFAEDARRRIKRVPEMFEAVQPEGRPLTARFAVAAWTKGASPASKNELIRALDEALRHATRDSVVRAL